MDVETVRLNPNSISHGNQNESHSFILMMTSADTGRRRSSSNSKTKGIEAKAVDLWQVMESLIVNPENDNVSPYEASLRSKFLSEHQSSPPASYTLVVGAPKSGKSTLIQKFLNPNKGRSTYLG